MLEDWSAQEMREYTVFAEVWNQQEHISAPDFVTRLSERVRRWQ